MNTIVSKITSLSVYGMGGLLILSSLLWLTGCQNTSNRSSIKEVKATVATAIPTPATTVPPPQLITKVNNARRVVALTSLSADITNRLSPTRLVGITGSTLLEKNPAFSKLPRVAEGRTPPNLEKIVALKPDLVIGAAGMHDGVLAQLQNSGIPTLATKVDRWEALSELTKTLASSLQADSAPLLKSYQGYFKPKPTKTASTLILASDQPLLAPNSKSWAGDLLTQFGVKNVIADLQGKSQFAGYLTLSPEKVVTIDPDVIILINAPGTDIAKVKANPLFKNLKATKNNRVYVFDYYGLVNPGSVTAIDRATKQLRQIYR
ncbi:ABC transporter substrate-binding protein [Chamaesiphon minutus]|uniref:ABC-type Fe3+-hydroxamate transport system, periplasmic component n=1 Tax=Chamaesiphon minutus (strain ATCC 27169 / PCC 6605) TaxID=1173020 RepID=K9UE29_CHAP6|nr:ABC transporter substrate-binding protein [Chamaesiphon minutus]AFY93362.1 ABC-type Fe3+-hydroxamate transport system, periplasmic component [Chamaesiphon minutus PCC 6605]